MSDVIVKPWMTPRDDFEEDASNFISDSPGAIELINGLRSCASPFIRAAILLHGCGAEDIVFLRRIITSLGGGAH